LIGTYSSIAIAAPILVAYQDWRSSRGRPAVIVSAAREASRGEKVKAKA
jgi:preprotein translocase subunit SecF